MLLTALIRFAIPCIIMSGIAFMLHYQGHPRLEVKSTFIVGLIISCVVGASVIYEITSWSLLRQSLVHLGVMTCTVLPLLFLSSWFPLNNLGDYLKVLGLFALCGVLFWSVGYVVGKFFTQG